MGLIMLNYVHTRFQIYLKWIMILMRAAFPWPGKAPRSYLPIPGGPIIRRDSNRKTREIIELNKYFNSRASATHDATGRINTTGYVPSIIYTTGCMPPMPPAVSSLRANSAHRSGCNATSRMPQYDPSYALMHREWGNRCDRSHLPCLYNTRRTSADNQKVPARDPRAKLCPSVLQILNASAAPRRLFRKRRLYLTFSSTPRPRRNAQPYRACFF